MSWKWRTIATGITIAFATLLAGGRTEPLAEAIATPSVVEPHTPHDIQLSAPHAPALAAVPVAGWIVDGAGLPIAGVRVALRGNDTLAVSEVDGAFRIAPPPANATLVLDAPHVFPAELAWRPGTVPRIMLARRMRIAARSLVDGSPISGAEVSITDGSRPTLATATTDRDGVARFEDLVSGPYEVWARSGDRVSPLARIAELGGGEPVELALAPGTAVRGQVVADAPLPSGTTVQLVPLDVDHAVRVAALDDHARFAGDGFPLGRWRVEAEIAGYLPSSEVIDTRAGGGVVVRLQRAGSVHGVVVDHAGGAVANATIVLRPQGGGTRAFEQRRTLASSARLRWVHPLAGRRQLPAFDASRFGASRPGSRPAECGLGHCGIDLGAKLGTIIHAAASGEIASASGELRGEAGRFVAIDHGDGVKTYYMHMDAVRAGLEAGQRVRAGDPIGTVGSTGFSTGPHLHFAITQEAGGRTWYIDPEPIARHAVVLATPRSLDELPRANDASVVVASARWNELGRADSAPPVELTTDANGRFRLDGVGPGSYVAVGFAAKLAPGTSAAFIVSNGADTRDVVVTLRPGTLVRGRVIGRNGAIAGAAVVAGSGSGENVHKLANAYTDASGEFVLHALAGEITLSVAAPGYGAIERAIALDDRKQRREDFALTIEDARLRGQVLAPDGGSAGVVSLRLVDGPTRRRAATDAHGQFAIERVAAGSYTLELASPEFPTKRVTLRSDEWKEFRLDPGGGARLALRDAQSTAPLSGIRVDATGPDIQMVGRVTDANGIIELRGLAVGAWTLQARGSGYAAATRSIAIVAQRIPQDVRVDLARGATLVGVVRDRYGRRVAGARVSIGSVATRSDSNGEFRLADAPGGPQLLEAEHDAARASLALQLAPGETRQSLQIELGD